VALAVVGCASSAPPAATPRPSPARVSPSPTGDPLKGSVLVRFRASDGVRLTGRLFGNGPVAVVLSHQTDDDQSDWFEFAAELRSHGYRALTMNFRGVCSSTPAEACSSDAVDPNQSWSDLAGAVEFLRGDGADAVFLIGASLGGEASIIAASKLGDDVQGLVSLSAPFGFVGLLDPDVERDLVASIRAPKLFMAGQGDRGFADAARAFYAAAVQPKQVKLLPGSDHGVALVRGAVGATVKNLIFQFLASNAPPA
jgi:pimeloyl-ACP methyl ester carboxylesterase